MNICIVGCGIVGLTLAKELVHRYSKNSSLTITLIDKSGHPSVGTSLKNSGVLHAGLYYKPNSLKSQLCLSGRSLLNDYIVSNSLPLLECGKLLVPKCSSDCQRLQLIYQNAVSCGASVRLLSYKEAVSIQPHIVKRDIYLWSPKTSVFSPSDVLNSLYRDLKTLSNVTFLSDSVSSLDCSSGHAHLLKSGFLKFDFIFNVTGYDSLRLLQLEVPSYSDLILVPFMGQYAEFRPSSRFHLKTNLYPVPDPSLPFLGIHLTPRPLCSSIVGPNAIPSLQENLSEFSVPDLYHLFSRLGIIGSMFITNKESFRRHALREFSLNIRSKFISESNQFFSDPLISSEDINMARSLYSIRPQLINKSNLSFVQDFILHDLPKGLHVVNAVSPAFTSSMAIASLLADRFKKILF